jgi:tryptophan-rich sensory protein
MFTAAFDHAWVVVAVFGAILAWLVWQSFLQAGQSTAALLRAIEHEANRDDAL